MKISKNFVLRQIAGTWVVLPLGAATTELSGMITLNETGVFLWKILENGATREELASALTEEYEVSFDEALADIDAFIVKLENAHCLEN